MMRLRLLTVVVVAALLPEISWAQQCSQCSCNPLYKMLTPSSSYIATANDIVPRRPPRCRCGCKYSPPRANTGSRSVPSLSGYVVDNPTVQSVGPATIIPTPTPVYVNTPSDQAESYSNTQISCDCNDESHIMTIPGRQCDSPSGTFVSDSSSPGYTTDDSSSPGYTTDDSSSPGYTTDDSPVITYSTVPNAGGSSVTFTTNKDGSTDISYSSVPSEGAVSSPSNCPSSSSSFPQTLQQPTYFTSQSPLMASCPATLIYPATPTGQYPTTATTSFRRQRQRCGSRRFSSGNFQNSQPATSVSNTFNSGSLQSFQQGRSASNPVTSGSYQTFQPTTDTVNANSFQTSQPTSCSCNTLNKGAYQPDSGSTITYSSGSRPYQSAASATTTFNPGTFQDSSTLTFPQGSFQTSQPDSGSTNTYSSGSCPSQSAASATTTFNPGTSQDSSSLTFSQGVFKTSQPDSGTSITYSSGLSPPQASTSDIKTFNSGTFQGSPSLTFSKGAFQAKASDSPTFSTADAAEAAMSLGVNSSPSVTDSGSNNQSTLTYTLLPSTITKALPDFNDCSTPNTPSLVLN